MSVKFVVALVALTLLSTAAEAGSCRYGSFGGRSTVTCTGGYYESTGRYGTRSYGYRNGGFARYPDAYLPGYANERFRR